jgi:hypothetical protein
LGRVARDKKTLQWSVFPAHRADPAILAARNDLRAAHDRRVGEKRPPEGAVGRCPVAWGDRADVLQRRKMAQARACAKATVGCHA